MKLTNVERTILKRLVNKELRLIQEAPLVSAANLQKHYDLLTKLNK